MKETEKEREICRYIYIINIHIRYILIERIHKKKNIYLQFAQFANRCSTLNGLLFLNYVITNQIRKDREEW